MVKSSCKGGGVSETGGASNKGFVIMRCGSGLGEGRQSRRLGFGLGGHFCS